ncbi:M48 family metallopeptidase [Sedimenticola hydrogenitrophicus]|uniref:M48 family metallopeptidase n=1 Tax=Sedimenticola hydrogenitrophicus TaxID=2967975 RepID=UPI0023B13E21|nr:M48 family metallopeptidase [Sedimenticola hydrogenitrophicus]
MKKNIPAAVSLLLWTLAGCVSPTLKQGEVAQQRTAEEKAYQSRLQVERIFEYQKQIERLGSPLLKAALPFCKEDQASSLGLYADNIEAWSGEYRLAATELFGLDQALKVTFVQEGSAAARAGLRSGDILLSVDGRTTLGGPGAPTDFARLVARSREGGEARELALEVLREGHSETLRVLPDEACGYPLNVLMHNAINAYADGDRVYITSGLLRFAERDEEVALVLAHEIAHNALNHIEAKIENARSASIFDLVAAAYGINTSGLFARLGANTYSKEFEGEADYLGLYILARAGFSLDGLDGFWQRMASEDLHSNRDSILRSHPITAERAVAIRQSIAEIEAKRKAGEPLLPNQ